MRNRVLLAMLCSVVMVSAKAAAQCADQACAHFGNSTTSVDANAATMLNALDTSLTGTNVSLSSGQYGLLKNANVSLKGFEAAIQTDGLAGSDAGALTANLSLSQAYHALATALTAAGNGTAAAVATNLSTQTAGVTGTVSLGNLVTSDARTPVTATTSLNALDLVDGLAGQYNASNVNSVKTVSVDPSTLGLTGLGNVTLSILVLQPAQFVCGAAGATFYSSSLRVKVHASLTAAPIAITVPGLTNVSISLTSLDLMLQIGRATGVLQSIAALTSAVTLQATPGVSEIYLGTVSDAAFLRRGLPAIDRSVTSTEFTSATLASLSATITLAGLSTTLPGSIGVKGYATTGTATPTTLMYNGPYPQSRTATNGTAPLSTALSSLLASMTLDVSLLGLNASLLSGLTNVVTSTLRTTNGLLGSTLSTLLGSVVNPLLTNLGVRFGEVDAVVDKVYTVASGATCDDTQYCTINDTCNGAGICAGSARDCSDGLSCTTDSCNEATDSCASSLASGCLIGGQCQAAGAVDPTNQCRSCIPAQSTTAYRNSSGTACDDGQFCTSGDQCALGVCLGGGARNCSDNLSCTADSCDEAADTCVSTPVLSCVVNGACYGTGAADPSNSCRSCNPLLSTAAFSNSIVGTGCDDGRFCTVIDTCNGSGTCGGTPRVCADLLSCTTDTCSDAAASCVFTPTTGCVIGGLCRAANSDDPTNACRSCVPETSTTAWTNKGSSATCDDGQYCTVGDLCNGSGTCAGSARDCSDGKTCTTDSCNELLDFCSSTVSTGCLIDGACRVANSDDPQNACHTCNPTLSNALWTNKALGTTCDDGQYCTTGDQCGLLGTCVGLARNCSDGVACTLDTCNEATSSCSSAPIIAGCVINSACYANGTDDPTNGCHTCNTALSTSSWSNKTQGTSCNDGKFCTVSDVCNATGTCAGSNRVCDDGLSCTADTCNDTLGACTSAPSGGCLILGTCYAEGADNPLNGCQTCNPTASTILWSNKVTGASCEDGLYCTQNDTCNVLGLCASGPARGCDDGVSCTSDSCNEIIRQCVSTVSGACRIGGTCVAAGAGDPSDQCRSCNPLLSTSAYSNKLLGTGCDDGQFCTTNDVCGLTGACGGLPRVCEDGLLCTSDVCDETADACRSAPSGGCAIDNACYLSGEEDPNNSCRTCNPAVSSTTWTNKASGVTCNDGLYCTVSDSCNAGGICAGSARTCDDGLACTSETCNETLDLCVPAIANGCLILGACVASGAEDPTDSCHVCDPTSSSITWTNKPTGTVCEDGLFCTSGDTCNALGLCTGPLRDCSDNQNCTLDVCDEANRQCVSTTLGCIISGVCQLLGATDPQDSCRVCNPSLSGTTWTNKAAGASCNDGSFCTVDDRCDAGGTCAGSVRSCSDGLACTSDACDEAADVCTSSFGGGCVIGGSCIASGTVNPNNPCQSCDPVRSTTGWSARSAGSACEDGLYCTQGETCNVLGLCLGGSARSCDDGVACTTDLCNELTRQCASAVTSGCQINGACIAAGTADPGNPCRVCNPLLSTTAWSNKLIGSACDDGMFCTVTDLCNGAGSCSGTVRSCSDGLACTADSCSESTRSCSSAPSSGCVISGMCVAAGTDDPSNGCRMCDPSRSTTAWTPKSTGDSCDDGQFCTVNDACTAAGSCTGSARSCDDGLACTSETCNETLDLCTPNVFTGCLVAGACVASGAADPLNSCHVCNPAVSALLWTNKTVGSSCDDGLFCTATDTCNALGLCTGMARNCSDNQDCTVDVCNEVSDQCVSTTAGCVIAGQCQLAGVEDPQSSCRVCNPLVSSSTWSPKPVGATCSDGLFCTVGDRCDAAGACQSTGPRSCDDGLACTVDQCDETADSCTGSFVGGCVIDASCIASGATNPSNPCQVCDPMRSLLAWSTKAAGATCEDGLYCTTGDTCSAQGQCQGGASRACDDGLACTTDVCNETIRQCVSTASMGCSIAGACVAAGVNDPGNTCRACDPTRSTSAWSNKTSGVTCDDHAFCTVDDACNGSGVCNGVARACSDGLPCTVDSCDETNDSCVSGSATGCVISGACYAAGTDDPSNGCHTCNPALASASWTNKASGTSCDDGQFCTVADACTAAGGCTGNARMCADDGLPCTAEVCNESDDVCSASVLAGCLIGNACVAAGAEDPDNSCHVCNPAASRVAWSNKATGTSCSDGQFCTVGDLCSAQGVCAGPARDCSDGQECTADVCNEQLDRCVSTTAGCIIAGLCRLAGIADPQDSCRMCDPTRSVSTWSPKAAGASCDDGRFCTIADACDAAGSCIGTANPCSDGNSCTTDTCDEASGACLGTFPGGCVIAGSCLNAGSVDPNNTCQICDPGRSESAWSRKPSGERCDDGLFCTVLDSCNGSGVCGGTARVCDDGVACTSEACDEASHQCLAAVTSGCQIDGSCVTAGTPEPGNTCRSCEPMLSTTNWSNSAAGTTCEDGEFCTVADVCDGLGACSGSTRGCDDGLPCTTDSCNEAMDRCTSGNPSGCVIAGACVAPGSDEPGNSCHTCNPTLSTSSWSNKANGVSCDDGRFCTSSDVCDAAGSCNGTARVCNDGLACTSERCDESSGACVPTVQDGCLIAGACVPSAQDDPDSSCRSCDPARSRTAWSSKALGSACDDSLFCTIDDACDSTGACSGAVRDCSDSQSCTADACDEVTQRCVATSTGCTINGVCYAAGRANPTNACQTCDPSRAASAWSATIAGGSCDDGRPCTTNDSCDASGTCLGRPRDCSDGLACTTDTCDDSGGGCRSQVNVGCAIDGACRDAGSDDPNNACHTCDPVRSRSSWSSKPSGTTCNDGRYCSVNDRCDQNGTCTGSQRMCDPGVDCASSICDEAGRACVPTTTFGCVINGTCWPPGSNEPGNACRTCEPSVSLREWTNKAAGDKCDDGRYCTVGEACNTRGVCVGAARACSDGFDCTTDSCDEAADTCRSAIGNACVIDGSCKLAGAADPMSACRSCEPGRSKTAWTSKAAGAACEDGLFCTIGETCSAAGACSGAAANSCSDNLGCTEDSCDETGNRCTHGASAGCAIEARCIAENTPQNDDPCLVCDPARSATTWTRLTTAGCTGIPPDQDPDHDGLSNALECPSAVPACRDTDGDGTPDYLDDDDDNDGLSTVYEARLSASNDSDNDGTADYLDADDDQDGVLTNAEGADPNGNGRAEDANDSDGDGVPDYLDGDDDDDQLLTAAESSDPDGNGLPNDARDTDGDGVPDYREADDDDDTLSTRDEDADPDGDGRPDDARDFDDDGIPDYLDTDDDGDGISTRDERADAYLFGSDIDGDGIPNWLDTDSNGNGIPDSEEGRIYTDGDPVPAYLRSLRGDGGVNAGSGADMDASVVDPRFDRDRGGVAGGSRCSVLHVGAKPNTDALSLVCCAVMALGWLRWRRRQR